MARGTQVTMVLFLSISLLFFLVRPAAASHQSGYSFYVSSGWSVYFQMTDTDGIRILHASWNGVENFRDMSLPQIMVEYQTTPASGYFLVDDLGLQGNNKPCPGPIQINTLSEPGGNTGFQLKAEFRFTQSTCGQFPPPAGSGYTYVQSYDFWSNGALIPSVKIYGPGMADDSRYHVYFVADIDAYAVADAGRWDDNFEFQAIQSWQYPPAEHAFYDDEVREVWWREWRNRNAAAPYQGYDYVPWIWGGFGPMPPYEAKDYTLVFNVNEWSTPEQWPNIPTQYFLNFPKDRDNNQDLAAPNNLVNWYVATVQSSVSPSYCKPDNHCGVGLWFAPVNQ